MGGGRTGGTNGAHPNEAQSAGCARNDLHCLADLCAGRFGMQFLRSSNVGTPRQAGGSPVKKLYEYVKFSSLGKPQSASGIGPEKRL